MSNEKEKIKRPNSGCPECSQDAFDFDPFNFGELLDDHFDVEIDDEELAKRLQNAMEMTRKLGGMLPGGLEGDLEHLIKPKLTWQDFVRFVKARRKDSGKRNDWNSPKRKPLFSGLYVPKKIDYHIKFLLAYDCSGSMTKEQITYGVSQIQALNEGGSGWCLPWDSAPFFDAMVKIKNAKPSELKNAKYKGGGGTVLSPVFTQYEKEIGHVDIIIIVSDFILADQEEVYNLAPPRNTEVIWLSVNGNPKFNPPFGRQFKLMND